MNRLLRQAEIWCCLLNILRPLDWFLLAGFAGLAGWQHLQSTEVNNMRAKIEQIESR